MIAKRIPHKTQCDHAQTPYARRKCRAAKLAAAIAEEAKKMSRFQVRSGRRMGVWVVIDTQTGAELMRNRDEAMCRRFATTRNEQAATGTLPQAPAAKPATPAPAPAPAPTTAPRTGWSKAARGRAGQARRSHPLGRVVEAGAGYTVYQDTALGGGRVQVWDHS